MGQFRDITIKEVIDEINVSYFLPDIQREYVWLDRVAEKKIEQLFDSILRNYPIGTFLFWRLKKNDVETDKAVQPSSDKLNFQLYKFIENYDVRNPHNEKIDITKVNSNDLHIVLDGQQRLTSLYIGLRGSRTLRKPRGRWDNPSAFETKALYLNLRYHPQEDNTDDSYQFEFRTPAQIPAPDINNYWFKVGDILTLKSIIKYSRDNNLSDEEAEILEKLNNAFCVDRLISYFEESEKNLDKVLKIFIRVNSGGTVLSYSDLLMSILTANFTSDIRGKMNAYVDAYKEKGFACFGRDQILKTCLLLVGANHVFNLKNFNRTNISLIENNWDAIVSSISDAIQIVSDCGYSGQLASGYIVSVIAFYLYNKHISYSRLSNIDKEAIFKFIRNAQITSYFTTSLDRKINNIKEGMEGVNSFEEFNDKMAKMDANKALKVTVEDIDDLLTLQYGQPGTLPVLQLLYPNLNYKSSTFHIDHIYPKSKFTSNNTALNPDYLQDKNYLFNLQLLEGDENISKSNTDPDIWVNSNFGGNIQKITDYKIKNYIDVACSLKWQDFESFKTKRTSSLRQALINALK